MDSDKNKIITPFSDCRGTCKTPIGCTCGKRENREEQEVVKDIISETLTEEVTLETETVENEQQRESLKVMPKEKMRLCNCGKNPNGICECKNKKYLNNKIDCCSGTHKLEVYNWMQSIPDPLEPSKMIEVQFKNTRKGYYLNSNDLDIQKGDVVAVEASPGHDIGEVTLTGKLVELQMKKTNFRGEVKRVYRIAKATDIEKYKQVKTKEHATMLRAREIAEDLRLDMKISDVEYQGDGNKAIFYYIADGRVDFRQLIKHYASEFRVKIEMKQIGARQEAGRVGGIGPCGRELCCSSSMSNFVSVSTQAARLQDIPLNPQKLAGQCGKLKCCLNFEADTYVEAQKRLPARDIVLETKDGSYYHFKTDVLSGMMTYSTDRNMAANLVTLSYETIFKVINQNRRGEKPLSLSELQPQQEAAPKSLDVLEDSITRFDSADQSDRNQRRNKNKKRRGNNPSNQDRKEGLGGERTAAEGPRLIKSKDRVKTEDVDSQTDQQRKTSSDQPVRNNPVRRDRNRNNRNRNRDRRPDRESKKDNNNGNDNKEG